MPKEIMHVKSSATMKGEALRGAEIINKIIPEINDLLMSCVDSLLSSYIDIPKSATDSSLNPLFGERLFKLYGSHYLVSRSAVRIDIHQLVTLMRNCKYDNKKIIGTIMVIGAHEMGHHVVEKLYQIAHMELNREGATIENFCDYIAGILLGEILEKKMLQEYPLLRSAFSTFSGYHFTEFFESIGNLNPNVKNYGSPEERSDNFWAGFVAKDRAKRLEERISELIVKPPHES